MLAALLSAAILVIAATFLHYEVLRALNSALPRLSIPDRPKVALVIIAAFLTHAAEMAMYGIAYYLSTSWLKAGTLTGVAPANLFACMYFSAETYTSLGLGDLSPTGPIRLLAGVEALNGLLLIGWSASFTYLSMERFWSNAAAKTRR